MANLDKNQVVENILAILQHAVQGACLFFTIIPLK